MKMLNRAIAISLIMILMLKSFTKGAMHPTQSVNKPMTCDQFSQSARFNPYSVLDGVWMVFYYWGPQMERRDFVFLYPTPKERMYLKKVLDGSVTIAVNWTMRNVIMKEVHTRTSDLLVEKGEKGQFWLYSFQEAYRYAKLGKKLEPIDIRLKQTADNKYIGLMDCDENVVLVMCRTTQIPPKSKIQDAAARIGYIGRGGKSYLNQGHQWMPIPEAEEEEYWLHPHQHRKYEEALEKYTHQPHHNMNKKEQEELERQRLDRKIDHLCISKLLAMSLLS